MCRPAVSLLAAVLLALSGAGASAGELAGVAGTSGEVGSPPLRVVSMNLCTDQLALLLAAPGQLRALSHLASDESVSVLSARARALPRNHGLAEEILRLDPDLVIAGTYTTRATVNLLRRLGLRVAEFAPARNFADIRENLTRMGALLHREAQARALTEAFDRELARLSADKGGARRPVLGSYAANSYTTGGGTLEAEIVTAAGFRHLGTELGLSGATRLPLESLIVANPDYVMSWRRWTATPARSGEILTHPALQKWFGPERRLWSDDRYWICGAPFTVEAVTALAAAVPGDGS
ncbi:ABC transporter substrate-binding protein [Stappia taiwanensis]|uniref:ABC transporter substrate-binding protein n=1 Tax=Stappia taiwanensis TaxID=992267 RepID=A0A838XX78_9HYPH|nr:ABC transporter substrate-binding protein [Stappia taiwanensis]MBA4613076.1 ABC transporter substrate-binding protein [Stappia taiwanensis]GGF01430.1 cobalamin ABC transporter substrate-binding protein [Stappia taiwanensis]